MGWIVVYKVVKVALALAGGMVALHLRHRNLVDVAQDWLLRLGLDPGGKICADLLARLANINPNTMRWLAWVLFLYAALYLTESVGLYLEKRWAEWFTVCQTFLIVPLEIYGLCKRPEPFKWLALATSLLIIAYLLWRIHVDCKSEQAERDP